MDGDEAPAHGDSNDKTDHNNNDNHNPGKASKRDRFKGALSRTKSKFKKHDNKSEAEINDEVNDFLAGGRTSTSSWTSGKDTLRPGTITTTQGYYSSLETSPADQASPRPSTSDSASISKHSPRKITVPKIDVSNSQRWPAAQPLSPQGPAEGAAGFLRPEYHGRSQSASSLTKRKGRARGLSVTFIDDPPTVIGEGGDDAPTPPLEISKAKARARSVSPMSPRVRQRPAGASRPTAAGGTGAYEYPRPPAAPASSPSSQHEPPDVLRPRGLQRVQTGLSPSAATASLGLDKEFEMTLQIGNQTNPAGKEVTSNSPEIIAPRPVRPVQPPPLVVERPDTSVSVVHEAQSSSSSSGRADDFREGDVLRMHHDPNIPAVEENTPASGSSREVSPVKQRQYQNFV